ncbi:hypothetical protein HB917_10860 [Listeria seeligeri]|uniref:hypothetical protein n=1 Tax=Listeria seeligeri TaxID=1640 RepID=UPI001628E390|nr:hypothetical protein [Listeria seeligeri]MBC1585698.1 hypothetical protein [Listeria seeligeri]MBC1599764.1 hypothetical protein [Listeria seeligeri]
MKTIFKLESKLVDSFISIYKKNDFEVLVAELPIRFGNIDVVSIKNSNLPFSKNQIETLSKPAAALIFTKIKNERPISKNILIKGLGLSKATIEHTLYDLLNVGLIVKNENGCYLRKIKFVFPRTIVTGYEAKLTDFNKAFYQAKSNKEYVDYSYLIFPIDVANKLLEKKKDLLLDNGIGLIGVSETKIITLVKAVRSEKMRNHIRLLSLAKVNRMTN